MIRSLRRRRPGASLSSRVEPLATILARLLPPLALAAVGTGVASLTGLGWSDVPRDLLWIVGTLCATGALTVAMLLPLPLLRWAEVPLPDRRTRESVIRSSLSYAQFGGITNLWITIDAVHVVSPNVHHVYPLSSLERIEARPPRSVLETFSPIPLAFNLVLHRKDGREIPLFVLAPVSVARSIRRAIRANTDERPSCLYRQGETT